MPLTNAVAAVPDEVDDERRTFLETIADILPERDSLIDKFDELIERFENHWDWWHRTVWNQPAYDQEHEIIERIRAHIEDTKFPDVTGGGSILEVADRVIDHHTPVVSLFVASMGWVQEVMSPISNVYSRIWTVGDGQRLVRWSGEARTVYDDIVRQQEDTTTAAKDLASFMSGWLAGIAEDNVGYARFLLDRLTEIVGYLAKAIAAIGTSAGVFTLEKLADAIGTAVALAIAHLGEIAERIASAVSRIIDAEDALADFSYFPDGAWPAAIERP